MLVARFGKLGRQFRVISKLGLVVVFCLLLAAQTLLFTYRAEAAAPTPSAHWTLDETSGTRADSIGSNNLSQVGTVNAVTGEIDKAADFPSTGGSKALTIADNGTVGVGGETSFSISMWVNLHSRASTQVFVGKYSGAGEYAVYYENAFSRFVFSTYSTGGVNSYVQANQLGLPATDTWYHITAVHNAVANTNSISINGGSFDTITNVPEPSDTSAAFVVGAFNSAGSSFPALAAIDDLKFWRTPLSIGDIGEIAEPPSPLVAHWNFDEGSGSSATDISGNGYTGTVSGATYSSNTPPVNFTNPHSLEFDGVDDGVSTSLSVNNYSQFTIAGWAYPRSAQASEGWFGANDVFEFIFNSSTELRCWTAPAGVNWSFAGIPNFLNNWHHITCLGDGQNVIMYVDGVEVARQAHAPTSNYGSGSNFSIGKGVQNGGDSGPFDGFIDDVRVYNRALTPEEMDGLGTGEAGPGGPDVPAIAVTTPADNTTTNIWNPVIDWGDSDECAYTWDNQDWYNVDCQNNGSDIPEPLDGIDLTLHIRGNYTGSTEFGLDSIVISYDTAVPSVNAGDNHQTNTGFTQTSATASDSLSGVASYSWSKQSGPGSVTFSNPTALLAGVTAVSLDGTYVIRLTVTDQAGNSAYDDFTLIWDTTSPEISLTQFPDLFSNQTTASFSFVGSETVSSPISYTCKIDAESFNSCSSPKAYSSLAEGAHTVTIRAIDSVGNMEASSPYAWTVDTTAPTLTRSGSNNLVIVKGQPYVDPGATASDTLDGTITENIVTTNPVNNNVVGSYTVFYNVSDRAGNAASEVTRSVTVVSDIDQNDDGLADAIQPYVQGITNDVSGKPAVLEADEACSIDDTTVRTEASNDEQDTAFDYPGGLFDFSLSCTEGHTADIKLYYYNNSTTSTTLRKYNPISKQYFTVDNAQFTNATINDQPVTVVSYQVTDGGPLDIDGQVNGEIVDPAGIAVQAETIAAPTNDNLSRTGDSNEFLIPLSTIGIASLTLAGVLTQIKKRRYFVRGRQ